jgi:hypothetical protein
MVMSGQFEMKIYQKFSSSAISELPDMRVSRIVSISNVRFVYAATLLVRLVVQWQTLDSRGR